MGRNWHLQLLALLMAVCSWYMVSGREKVETWVEIPFEFVKLPKDFVITSGLVSKLEVRVSGSKALIRGESLKNLAYTADFSELQLGLNIIILDQGKILPLTPLEIIEMSPSRLELQVDRIVTRTVPVEVRWEGDLDPDFKFESSTVKPSSVQVQGPERVVSGLENLKTQPIEVEDAKVRELVSRIGLDIPKAIETGIGEVEAVLNFGPKKKDIWVKRPLEVIPPKDTKVNWQPNYVRIKIEIPIYLMRNKDWRESLKVVLDLRDYEQTDEKEFSYKVMLPMDAVLVEAKPQKAVVSIKSEVVSETSNSSLNSE